MYPITVMADDYVQLPDRHRQRAGHEGGGELIAQWDLPPATDEERSVRPYPLQFADLGSVTTAITARFADNARRPVQDQVTLTPDYVNNTLLVTASPENHAAVQQIVSELDKSDIANVNLKVPTPVRVENVLASNLAKTLNDMIRASKRVDRRTGTLPVTVTANDAANTLLVTASPKDLEEMKALIAELDVPMAREDERIVKPYPVRYADLNSVMNIVKARFESNKTMGLREQVSAVTEPATGTLGGHRVA